MRKSVRRRARDCVIYVVIVAIWFICGRKRYESVRRRAKNGDILLCVYVYRCYLVCFFVCGRKSKKKGEEKKKEWCFLKFNIYVV